MNLERSLRVGDRISGHLVQGHVDATVEVLGLRNDGDDRRVRLALPPELARFVVFKGSITLQGVSLTVASVDEGAFEVALVPYTLRHTTLGRLEPGRAVNVEVDVIARYLEGMLSGRSSPGGPEVAS